MSSRTVVRGFFGKIPARGDFVRFGLPAHFITPLDVWAAAAVMTSQARIGPDFRATWLRAPAWRFVLFPGICGPDAAMGVWLPGTDRIGRLFPLVLAILGNDPAMLSRAEGSWLALAEQAGRDALAGGDGPDLLAARISAPPAVSMLAVPPIEAGSVWWTEGGPRVAPRVLAGDALPQADRFAGMLDDAFAAEDAT